ncbi:MAG TPA: hypothetical protein VII47_00610 [Actinomycetota bacterium]|jgi:uncharacterized iron-regulated membrane protein
MASLRRLWWMLMLGALATLGMACSGSSAPKAPKIGAGVSTGQDQSAPPASGQAGAAPPVQPAGNAPKGPAPAKGSPGQDGTACKQCQSSNDAVKLSDADGYPFETGEAEAGRIQAGPPSGGAERPATFDGGQGMKGTTGSSNLRPH